MLTIVQAQQQNFGAAGNVAQTCLTSEPTSTASSSCIPLLFDANIPLFPVYCFLLFSKGSNPAIPSLTLCAAQKMSLC